MGKLSTLRRWRRRRKGGTRVTEKENEADSVILPKTSTEKTSAAPFAFLATLCWGCQRMRFSPTPSPPPATHTLEWPQNLCSVKCIGENIGLFRRRGVLTFIEMAPKTLDAAAAAAAVGAQFKRKTRRSTNQLLFVLQREHYVNLDRSVPRLNKVRPHYASRARSFSTG